MLATSNTHHAASAGPHAGTSPLDNASGLSPETGLQLSADAVGPFSWDMPAQESGQLSFGTEFAGQYNSPAAFTSESSAFAWSPAALGLSPGLSGLFAGMTAGSPSAVVSTSGSGLVFDNTYGSSCTAQYEACIVAAEKQLESLFSNSVTINVSFAETNSGNNGVALGNSSTGWNVSYSTLRTDLLKVAPGDVLPSTDPSGGANWYIPASYARMLGYSTYTGSPDLSVSLNTYYSWDFGQDVINGLTHELSEGGLGRIGALGGSGGGSWSTMDLFRYNAAGQADYTNGRDGDTTYFSANGGTTLSNENLPNKGAPTLSYNNQYNSSGTKLNGGDTADWTQQNVFGSTGGGETLALTQTELEVMQALGWHLTLAQDVDSGSGAWETPTDWSTGSMPIEPQDVYISAASVTLDSNVLVNSIATAASTLLEIGDSSACTVTAVKGTDLNSEDSSTTATGNLGDIVVYAGSTLQMGYLNDTFSNAGSLTIGKGAGAGHLDIAGAITFSGGGTVALGYDGGTGEILNESGTTGDSLFNTNNVITGSGLIELGDTFDNQLDGVVEAQSSLQISAGTFTNEGIITAEANATLDFGQDGGSQSLGNSGSVLIDAGAHLAISGNYDVSGSGTLAFKGAGAEIVSDGKPATFTNNSTIEALYSGQIGDGDLTFANAGSLAASGSGVVLTVATGSNAVVNSGTLSAANGATLAIESKLTNNNEMSAGTTATSGSTTGTLDLGTKGSIGTATNTDLIAIYGNSDLAISGTYTVSGSGEIGFKGAGAEITSDGTAPAVFTNASTIEGLSSGQIGDTGLLSSNDLTFINTGSVYAAGTGVTLTLNTGGNTIDDTGGLLEAHSSATLAIDSAVDTQDGTSGLAGGRIEALSGGSVILGGGLSGSGSLVTAAGAVIDVTGGGSFGGAVSGAGTLEVGASSSFTLAAGASLTIADVQVGAGAILDLQQGGKLSSAISGGGTLQLDGTTAYTLAGAAVSISSVAVDAGATLQGAGTVTSAVIDSGKLESSSGTLAIDGALSGGGTLNATSGHVLDVAGGGGFFGTLVGLGTVQVDGAAAFVLSGAGASISFITVDAGATLAGSGSIGSTVTDNGTIDASGGRLVLDHSVAGSGVLEAASGATLTLEGGGALGAVSGAGTLELLSGGFTLGAAAPSIAKIKIDAAAGLSGAGSIAGSVADGGTLTASGGTLSLMGGVNGNGTLVAAAGAVLDIADTAVLTGSLTGAGEVQIAAGVTLNAGASLSAASVAMSANLTLGTGVSITNGAGDSFAITAAAAKTVLLSGAASDSFTNAGTLLANGAGLAEIKPAFINSGLVTASSGSLSLVGAVTNSGTIDASAGLVTASALVGGTGTMEVGGAGTLSLLAGAGAGQMVDFLAGTGLLDLTKPIDFAGTISGFGGADRIDLLATAETSFSYANQVLTVDNGTTAVAKLHFTGASNSFSLASDMHGGTLITFG